MGHIRQATQPEFTGTRDCPRLWGLFWSRASMEDVSQRMKTKSFQCCLLIFFNVPIVSHDIYSLTIPRRMPFTFPFPYPDIQSSSGIKPCACYKYTKQTNHFSTLIRHIIWLGIEHAFQCIPDLEFFQYSTEPKFVSTKPGQ